MRNDSYIGSRTVIAPFIPRATLGAMKSGHISQTALKVALLMITLDAKPGWKDRLPEGLAELTERLLLAAGVFGYGPSSIRVCKQPWVVQLSDYFETMMPGSFEGIGERKIFVNDQVLAAVGAGATQVLVLGAGFDTLCLRLAPLFQHVQFVEVDRPATASAKAKGVKREGWPENMHLLAADLNETPLTHLMTAAAFWDTGARSVVVAEGLLLYLEDVVVLDVFREIAACTGPGTRIVFSHGISLEQYRFTNAMLRLIGEPWLSSCTAENLPEYIGPGWSVIATQEPRSPRALERFAVAEKIRTETASAR